MSRYVGREVHHTHTHLQESDSESDYGFPQVFPKTGQLIVQAPAAPPVSVPSERSIQELSSGAGELSDSVSVGEVAVSSIRKKKMKVR